MLGVGWRRVNEVYTVECIMLHVCVQLLCSSFRVAHSQPDAPLASCFCRRARRLSLLRVRTCAWCVQIRLVEGRDRPIDRLAKNVLLFGQQDAGEVDVSGGRMLRCQLEIV